MIQSLGKIRECILQGPCSPNTCTNNSTVSLSSMSCVLWKVLIALEWVGCTVLSSAYHWKHPVIGFLVVCSVWPLNTLKTLLNCPSNKLTEKFEWKIKNYSLHLQIEGCPIQNERWYFGFYYSKHACLRGKKLASYSKRAVCPFQVPSGLSWFNVPRSGWL